MYRGPVLAAAAQDFSPTCGPLLPVVPPLSHAIPVNSLNCAFNKAIKGQNE